MQAVAEVRRVFDAGPINQIINHPRVRPLLGGDGTSEIDVQGVIDNPDNIVLHRDGFAAIFLMIQPGIFEVHTQALPAAREAHTVYDSARAMLHWFFTRTPAHEVLTRCPDDNVPARKLAEAMGFRFQYRLTHGWIVGEDKLPCDVLALSLNDWLATAPNLQEAGEEFHDTIAAAFAAAGVEREPHPSDETHDRYAGAAYEMVKHGQFVKAVLSYNRWAAMAGYRPISVLQRDPLIIHIGDAAVAVGANGALSIVKGQ